MARDDHDIILKSNNFKEHTIICSSILELAMTNVDKIDNHTINQDFSSQLSRPIPSVTFGDGITHRIISGEFKIAIYGLGHVGSPMASAWLRAGANVIGIDKSPAVVEKVSKGRSHIPEPGVSEAFSTGLTLDRFKIYSDPVQASRDSYFKMICVPVLLSEGGYPDLTAVKDVATNIGKGLKKGDVIALNPSVPPGTTEDLILPMIEQESGLLVENDFYMLYNPERIYEGRAILDIEERYPAIIAGAGKRSLEVGKLIYPMISKRGVLAVSNIRTAETEKLLEGVYRDVNIALANELARYCEGIGVNFWECREAANSQPYCHLHNPGVGVGGACIPVYPHFILHSSAQAGVDCEMIKVGRSINTAMPARCVEEAIKLFDSNKTGLLPSEATVTLLGMAFRGDVSDTRLSPTYDVIKEFQKVGVREIRIHDPLVRSDAKLKEFQNVVLTSDLANALKDTDLVMLIADHSQYSELTPLQTDGAPIYDGRGILNRTFIGNPKYGMIGMGNNRK